MRQSAPASVMADRQRSQSMYAAGRESEVEVDVSSFTRYADEPGPSAGLHLLTSGSVRAMYRDGERPKHPSVQLVDLVTLEDSKRVKCNISDGHECGAAVLTAALSARVLSGELAEGARVKLVHYAMNEIASVRLCMVTKIDVHEAKGGRIGVPRRYDGSSCDDVRTLAVLRAHFSEPEPPPPPKAKSRRA